MYGKDNQRQLLFSMGFLAFCGISEVLTVIGHGGVAEIYKRDKYTILGLFMNPS